jgi:hypothetical protein
MGRPAQSGLSAGRGPQHRRASVFPPLGGRVILPQANLLSARFPTLECKKCPGGRGAHCRQRRVRLGMAAMLPIPLIVEGLARLRSAAGIGNRFTAELRTQAPSRVLPQGPIFDLITASIRTPHTVFDAALTLQN